MKRRQSTALDRKKFFSEPILVFAVVVLIVFLALFVIYPLAILLVDSIYANGHLTGTIFDNVIHLERFQVAFWNTLKAGFLTGIISTVIGLLFAYVDVYVRLRSRVMEKLFNVVSLLPVVSPPFVLSLSMICLFGRSGLITRQIFHIYDSNVYGLLGIVVTQTLTFFPVCYLMLRGLLKNIDPSLEEAARDMGASRWRVFKTVTLPLMLPGLGNAFLVTFIESAADFANPMVERLKQQGIQPVLMTLPPIDAGKYLDFICRDGLSKDKILS